VASDHDRVGEWPRSWRRDGVDVGDAGCSMRGGCHCLRGVRCRPRTAGRLSPPDIDALVRGRNPRPTTAVSAVAGYLRLHERRADGHRRRGADSVPAGQRPKPPWRRSRWTSLPTHVPGLNGRRSPPAVQAVRPQGTPWGWSRGTASCCRPTYREPPGARHSQRLPDARSAADVCTLSGGCRAWTRGRGGGRRCWAAARAGVLTPHSTAPPSEARARFPHTSSGCAVMLRGKVVRLTRARTVKAELVVTTRKVSISVGLVALAVLAAGCGSGDQARESPATTTSVSASATPVPGSSTTTPDASASVTTTAGDATSDDYVSDTITCYEDTTSQ
jgi:hypothetical protein